MWRKSGPRAIFIQGVAFQLGLDSVAFQEAEGQKGRKALLCVALKAFFSNQCKEIEENNRMGKTRDVFKKNQRYQRNTSCKDGLDKGQKWYGPNRSRRY